MSKFRFIVYTIGIVLLFSSFDVQKCAEALQKAYEEKDYDAYVDAFPDKYENFVNVYGYDKDNFHVLYYDAFKHIKFLFSNDKVLESKVLDKLLSLSFGYIWQADAVNYVIYETKQILLIHPKRFTEYFSGKTDEEVISFIQMAFTCLLSDDPCYLSKYNQLIETYTTYSDRIVKLAKLAFERAKKACDVLVVY